MKKKKTKYALVLSGGGFNGAFQLGALNYMNNNWTQITGRKTPMHFDLIAGVSTGALNGAMIALNKLEELNKLWKEKIAKNGASEIYTSDFIDTQTKDGIPRFKPNFSAILKRLVPNLDIEVSFTEKLAMLFSKSRRNKVFNRILSEFGHEIRSNIFRFKSIADNTPLRHKLHKLIDRRSIDNTKFFCGFVSLDTGEYHNVSHEAFCTNEDFVNGILASTSMPLVWKPVQTINYKHNGKTIICRNNVDGGLRNVSPLGDLITQINQERNVQYKIIIINCHTDRLEAKSFDNANIAALTGRSVYEIAFNEVFRNDIHHFTELNNIVRQSKAWDNEIALFNRFKSEIMEFDTTIINPMQNVDLGGALAANNSLIEFRMQHGQQMAANAFKNTNKNTSWK